MPYSLAIFWRERIRFLPAVLAVTFSAVLIVVQCGVLLGYLAVASRPIDRAAADLWIGSPDVATLGYSDPIPESWHERLASRPDIVQVEPYYFGWGFWHRRSGGMDQCYIVGSRLENDSLGTVADLTPECRRRLTRPGAVAVYDADWPLLGLHAGTGQTGEINEQRTEVVARMGEGHKAVGLMPGVFASLRTARSLALADPGTDQVTYLLARCRNPRTSSDVARQLREQYPDMTVLTRAEFSRRTQLYWLTKTKAGLSLLFAALLGTVVGAVITCQTLYAAVVHALPQYALLRAMGIPRWRLRTLVLAQSWWVAMGGLGLAIPVVFVLYRIAAALGIDVLLPAWLILGTSAVTLGIAWFSGLLVLPYLRRAQPATLLR